MRKSLLGSLALLIGVIFQINAQDRHCASHEVYEQQIATDKRFAQKQANLEAHTQRFIQNYNSNRLAGGQVIIPCIVHVVYGTTQENISDAQVQSQITRLNADFAATNSDYNQVPSTFTSVRSGDTDIRFELIEIKRYADSRATWGTNDAVKAAYPPIEPSRILNMWVADIGGGILGYAQFPGGSLATDGVVMSPQYFGDASASGGGSFYLSAPFNLGRTATHEVGHWLNLRHIWGDGNCNADDFVSDTPTAGNPNYGCPSAGTNSCSGGLSDMFMNYMDYVDDACMFMFSSGQDARMQATFANGGGREGFLLDPVYTPGGDTGGGDGGGATCDNTEITLSITTDNYGSETSWAVTDGSGSTVASGGGYGNNQAYTESICLADGDYTFTITDSYGDGICCAYGNGSYSLVNGSTGLASGGSFGTSEATDFTIGTGGGSGGGGTGGSDVTIFADFFESGFGNWNDGGSDCARYNNGTYSYEGNSSIRIRDNSGVASSMTSDVFSATTFASVEIEFYFYANSMENGEDFWLQANNGSGWQTLATYARGTDFNNGSFYSATVPVSSGLTNNMQFRFRCDASGNNDQIYIDQVTVTGLSGTSRTRPTLKELTGLAASRGIADLGDELDIDEDFSLYPNPASDILNVLIDDEVNTTIQIYNISGQLVQTVKLDNSAQINVGSLKNGVYILKAVNGDGVFTKRFTKQ